MKPKTRELLNFLLWSADLLCRPTVRNLTDSYESWAYRSGMWRQVAALERQGLLECESKQKSDRLYRLTEQGRLCALGGRDPEKEWARRWDGRWRLVLFDVPVASGSQRDKLRRYLRDKTFGCLQGSVWVSPDPLNSERDVLKDGSVNVNSLILLEGNPCAGEKNSDIVAGAWDFENINSNYRKHLQILQDFPETPLHNPTAGRNLQRWAAAERQAWLHAVSQDPLLPETLWPGDYLGRRAWRRRVEVLREAAQLLRTYQTLSQVRQSLVNHE